MDGKDNRRARQYKPNRLTGQDVACILWRAMAVGVDVARLGDQSLRVGFATESCRRGVSSAEIMRQSGHKAELMITLYTRSVSY
jgi:hypothetical protein